MRRAMEVGIGMVNCEFLAPSFILFQLANPLSNCAQQRGHTELGSFKGRLGKRNWTHHLLLRYGQVLHWSSPIIQEEQFMTRSLKGRRQKPRWWERSKRYKLKLLHISALGTYYSIYVSTWWNEKFKQWVKLHKTETASYLPSINSSLIPY